MRYMLMICDDEWDDRGPRELVRDTDHVSWIDYMDRHGISMLDGVRLRPSSDATKVRSRNGIARTGRCGGSALLSSGFHPGGSLRARSAPGVPWPACLGFWCRGAT